MPITRDEVAHLAELSRLALTDDELDHFAGQLDVIIASVARVQEVAADGHPADDPRACPLTNVFRDDVERAVPGPGAGAVPGPGGRAAAASGSRGSWRRTEHERADRRMTAAELARCHRRRRGHARVEVTQAHLDRIAAVDAAGPRVPARRRRPGAGRGPRRRRPSAPRASRSARWPACRWPSRTCSPPRTCRPRRVQHPGGLAAALRRHRDPAAARGRA